MKTKLIAIVILTFSLNISCTKTKTSFTDIEVRDFTISKEFDGVSIQTYIDSVLGEFHVNNHDTKVDVSAKKIKNKKNLYLVSINITIDNKRIKKWVWQTDMIKKTIIPVNNNAKKFHK